MGSTSIPTDLTARARVRDAAIKLIAANGFEKTSVKAIAEQAGVSPGLVIHHFGSKAELRRICDSYVIATLIEEPFASASAPSPNLMREMLALAAAAGPRFDYLTRLLAEPGAAGDGLFARLLASTEHNLAIGRAAGSVRPASDPEATALLVTAFGLAQFLVRERFARSLGVDPLSPAGAARLTIPTLEILTHGLYADPTLLRAAEDALSQPQEPTPHTSTH